MQLGSAYKRRRQYQRSILDLVFCEWDLHMLHLLKCLFHFDALLVRYLYFILHRLECMILSLLTMIPETAHQSWCVGALMITFLILYQIFSSFPAYIFGGIHKSHGPELPQRPSCLSPVWQETGCLSVHTERGTAILYSLLPRNFCTQLRRMQEAYWSRL